MIKLYGMGSPNVRKVVIMLEELGLPYELVHVAVFKGEQFTPEFLAMNPLAKVPVLVDPTLGAPLAESAAILFWLAEREGRFFPAEGAARYETMQWLITQMAMIGPMFGQLNHFRLLPPGTEPYAEARYAEQSERLYRILDDRLATREWIAGGDYSIADMAIHPWAKYLKQHGLDWADYPALSRWCTAIDARPAVVRAAERIEEAFTEAANETRRAATATDLDRFFARTETMPEADYWAVTRV